LFQTSTIESLKNSLTSGSKQRWDKCISSCKEGIAVAKRCHAKWITVVPENYDNSLPLGVQTVYVMDTLQYGCNSLEKHGLIVVQEGLSDSPDLFFRLAAQTYLIRSTVKRAFCKMPF
jgi:hydroxypyruvate isomerase